MVLIKKRAKKKRKNSKKKTVKNKSEKSKAKYEKRVKKLKSVIWLGWIPRIIGLTFGILWLLFGLLESISVPDQWYIGLVEGLIVGGGILVSTWILFKKELAGAIIFSAEAVFVFSLLIFRRVSYVATYLALGTPLLLIAMLAFIHYFVVKELVEEHS